MTSWEPRRYVTHVARERERERVAGISQPLAEPADVPRSGWREKPTRANENKEQAVREREGRNGCIQTAECQTSPEGQGSSCGELGAGASGGTRKQWNGGKKRSRGREKNSLCYVFWNTEAVRQPRAEQRDLRLMGSNQQLKITRFKSHFSPKGFFFLCSSG